MKFIELTEHNLTDSKYDRTLFLNVAHIQVVVRAPQLEDKPQDYTVIGVMGEGDPTYYVKESYETVCAMIRVGYA